MSWWTIWKCHLYLPVSASRATIEAVNRFSPSREAPSHGDAFEVEKKIIPVSGFTVGVFQIEAPPSLYASVPFGHVLPPVSLGDGVVQKRHSILPVCAFSAVRRPRMPYSPPEPPT